MGHGRVEVMWRSVGVSVAERLVPRRGGWSHSINRWVSGGTRRTNIEAGCVDVVQNEVSRPDC